MLSVLIPVTLYLKFQPLLPGVRTISNHYTPSLKTLQHAVFIPLAGIPV
jgi:hypothetical protein